MSARQAARRTERAGGAGSWLETFRVFLKLGLTSFGGPIAHLGYFRDEFVQRRKWLSDSAYADLVALCQFLPGPASSQVGIAIGLTRAGWSGALAAWLGFTLPSALAMILFAYGVGAFADDLAPGWLRGLKVVAVAVVANAVWGMARSLVRTASARRSPWWRPRSCCSGRARRARSARSCSAPRSASCFRRRCEARAAGASSCRSAGAPARCCLALFFMLLIGLPILAAATDSMALRVFDSFYRAGSLVFGGGHVVLPLLQAGVVDPGWVTRDAFVAGYGAAQAVPGPLFTFAAYLGTVMTRAAERRARRAAVPARDLPAVVPAGDRRAAVLGRPAAAAAGPGGTARRQCRRGGAAARRAVRSGVDQRRSHACGLRPGACGACWHSPSGRRRPGSWWSSRRWRAAASRRSATSEGDLDRAHALQVAGRNHSERGRRCGERSCTSPTRIS